LYNAHKLWLYTEVFVKTASKLRNRQNNSNNTLHAKCTENSAKVNVLLKQSRFYVVSV
jgi:hypothetical protein